MVAESVLRVIGVLCLFAICDCALTDVNDAPSHFMGCAPLSECDMDAFFLRSRSTSTSITSDRFKPIDCINHCKNFAQGASLYSFAGVAYETCYCFDAVHHLKFLKRMDKRCEETCPKSADCRESNLVYIYTVCPFGRSLPPLCEVECPTYCLGKKVGQKYEGGPVCDRRGRCIYGCANGYCSAPETCETVIGGALTVAKDAALKAEKLKPITPAIYVFKDLCFASGGYIIKAEFYGRTAGSAYASIWRPHNTGNGTHFEMLWKFKMMSNIEDFTEVNFLPNLHVPCEVQKGDCLGIHFDDELMRQFPVDADKSSHTVVYVTDDPQHGASPYYTAQNLFDNGWKPGLTFDLTAENENVSMLAPSVSLTLTCECAATCKDRKCNNMGECADGCVPGFKGAMCDETCADNEYGPGCKLMCSTGCKDTFSVIEVEGKEEEYIPRSPCDSIRGTCISGCKAGSNGAMCDIKCGAGFYGEGCLERCGVCTKGTDCNPTSGECPSGCDPGFQGALCKEVCQDNTYGLDCAKSCGNCNNNMPCNPETGVCPDGCEGNYNMPTCKCTGNKWGENCDQQCGACESEICNDQTGECGFGCTFGYKPPMCIDPCDDGTWGPNCQEECGHCLGGAKCDKENGLCTGDAGCDPGYIGASCTVPCPQGTYGAACALTCGYCDYSQGSEGCRSTDGSCMYGCQGGFGLPDCTKCADGYYGDACLKCGKCKEGKQCSDDGTCPDGCDPGVKDTPGCNEPCLPGTWGDNCQETCGFCMNCAICSVTNGNCENNCKPGYMPPLCKAACAAKTYGPQCNKECGHCKNGASCDPFGVCLEGCDGEYIPPSCEVQSCPPGVWGTRCHNVCGKCKQGATCNVIDGSCPGACAVGYMGEFCVERDETIQDVFKSQQLQKCAKGRWGDGCRNECGQCLAGGDCDDQTGNCGDCELGFDPPMCTERCKPGTWGERCLSQCGNCGNDKVCRDIDGYCDSGCKMGYLMPTCNYPCDSGWYGADCTLVCGHCRGSCHFQTGICSGGCEPNWQGDRCQLAVRSSSSSAKKLVVTIFAILKFALILAFV